ncbi:hypothetical protein KIN20_011540 [Parelaphostrongylus tenuis]|uniref:Uncharacterized protein n=1 Tax=Parelaphostrongylus tenuis TaxID=148309 RepID=A0AAD5ME73_PARTN|nr:hypothetical protein KIN20_011540 [Parelaphostrongylus tenuis]
MLNRLALRTYENADAESDVSMERNVRTINGGPENSGCQENGPNDAQPHEAFSALCMRLNVVKCCTWKTSGLVINV